MKESTAQDTFDRLKSTLDVSRIQSLHITNVYREDHPDYADAYVDSGEYSDGTALTENELAELYENHNDLVYEYIFDQLLLD